MTKHLLRLLGALFTSTALIAAGLLWPALSGTSAAQAADAPAPSVLPALQSWTPASGSLQLSHATRIVVDGQDAGALATARTFADDLRSERGWPATIVTSPTAARAGDITLTQDADRSDLGEEGYALKVGDKVEITAGTSAGLFYGTRTVLQMLSAGDTLPAGSTVDVPKYAERGVALCACYTYNTVEWIDRMIKDMAYLKLNYLHLELKLRSDVFPKNNDLFSYYTPDEIKGIVALATKYHITVVPEVNSPGHIDPFITNYPDLQLVGKDGKADPTRLDVTKPEAFTFYTKLIDEYLKLFPGKYWHMGADEYMLGSAYDNYPQLLAYARQKYGPDAVAQDAYIDFINRVDAYVRSKGKTLRIWNDGLTGANTVPLNKDVTVEYWLNEPVKPQDLLDGGHTVMNASSAWYYVRGGYAPDSKGLYDSGWSPLVFPGQTVADGQAVSGAELTVWPDNYGKETENTTQSGLFMPLRVFAQAMWGSPKPTSDYAGFQQLANGVGHAPGWGPAWVQPLKAGSYVVQQDGAVLASPSAPAEQLVTDTGRQTWRLEPTSDGYYRLVSDASGLCADMQRGTRNRLGVVEQIGAPVTAETCNGSTTQEWQIEPVNGGYRVVNAITQEAADVEDGLVAQQPRDVATADVWEITPSSYVAPAITVTPTSSALAPGGSTAVEVTIDNTSGGLLKNVKVTFDAGDGWTLDPTTVDLGTIAKGAKVTAHTTLTAPGHNAATTLTAAATYQAAGVAARVDGLASVTALSAHNVYSQSYNGPSYKRLTREISVPAGGGALTFWTDHNTEQSWDYMFVEAHTPGQDDWTTLPDANGHTSTTPGDSCTNGWVSLHPQLAHYQTYANGSCTSTGTTGSWNAATGSSGGWEQWKVDLSKWAGQKVEVSISYASDWGYNEKGVYVDDVTLPDGTTSTFEDGGLDGWTVPGAPTGDPANPNDFVVTATQ